MISDLELPAVVEVLREPEIVFRGAGFDCGWNGETDGGKAASEQ
jgi:hypothetical protein